MLPFIIFFRLSVHSSFFPLLTCLIVLSKYCFYVCPQNTATRTCYVVNIMSSSLHASSASGPPVEATVEPPAAHQRGSSCPPVVTLRTRRRPNSGLPAVNAGSMSPTLHAGHQSATGWHVTSVYRCRTAGIFVSSMLPLADR